MILNTPSTDDHIVAGDYNTAVSPDEADRERIGQNVLPPPPNSWRLTNHVHRHRAIRFKNHLARMSMKTLNTWTTNSTIPATRKARHDKDNDSQID